ncbi:MAG: hypothetical protein RLZZ272_1424 [Actinomycetota bacterium]
MIPIPACSIVTAPFDGRLVTLIDPDTRVEVGDVVAVLEGSRGPLTLRAHQGGRVGGALQHLDEAVAAGEAVVWLAR